MSNSETILKVSSRNETGSSKSRQIRREGKIPAVIYGHNKDSRQCVIEVLDWQSYLKSDSQLVKLILDETSTKVDALVKDIQHDYLSGKTLHIDFQEINMNEEITTTVPLEAKGTPAGESEGGLLDQLIYELEVSCLPSDLPESIEVDVAELSVGDSISVKDLILPEKVSCSLDDETTLFILSMPKVQAESEESDEGEGTSEGEGSEAKSEE